MARRPRHADVNLYLPAALVATSAVVIVPSLVGIAAAWRYGWPVPFALLCGVTVAGAVAGAGASWWKRRPQSVDLTFGELLIWGWVKRKRAEADLLRAEHVLGIERVAPLKRRDDLQPEQKLALLRQLTAALESKDPYTHGHSRRVERHVARMGRAMGLSEEDIATLCQAASLHDVGKIRVPDTILRKPGELTIEERVLVQEHTLVGAWMVAGAGTNDVTLAVRHHHERWDGKGYPDGLEGSAIPLHARIIAVADAYDAMTSSRPYRPPLPREHAVHVLEDEAGEQFDPRAVDAFISGLKSPLPVPAFVPAAIVSSRWARRAAGWSVRAGAAKIGTAAVAVGVASLLGAAMISPRGGADPGYDRPAIAGPSDTVQESAAGVRHDSQIHKESGRASSAQVAGKRVSRPAPPRPATRSAVAVGDRHARDAHPAPAANDEKIATTDPQPIRGRDCIDHPVGGQGGGNAKHCGD